jgi:hypothetical protein
MGHQLNAPAWLADKLAASGTLLRRGSRDDRQHGPDLISGCRRPDE